MAKGYSEERSTEFFNPMTINNFLKGLPDQSLAYEILTKNPYNLTVAIDMTT